MHIFSTYFFIIALQWWWPVKSGALSRQEGLRSCLNVYSEIHAPCVNCLNTLRPRQDGRHFADDDFKRIFLNENVWISIDISPKFIPKGPIDNIPALVQIMAWRRSGDKPLSEPMVVRLPTHICVTRINSHYGLSNSFEFEFDSTWKTITSRITSHTARRSSLTSRSSAQ